VDVLFGQAYFLRFDPKLWAAQQPYAPLGSLYAAACVRERGYSVALFDAMLAASESEWAAALDRHRPRFAVIYEDNFNYLSKMCLLRMRQAALTMIDAARARKITTIVAGAGARHHPRPRHAAVPRVGSRRRRSLPVDLAIAPRLLLDEPGDDARLSVSLQLVREADLRPALHGPLASACRR